MKKFLFIFATLWILLFTMSYNANAQTCCKAITKKGMPCKKLATEGENYCPIHSPETQCAFIKKNGERCKGRRMKDKSVCYFHSTRMQ